MASVAKCALSTAMLLFAANVAAQATTPAPSTTGTATPAITAVSSCHPHETVQWCMVGTDEYQVVGPTATEEMESQYTDCHTHGSETYCVTSEGEDVQILIDSEEEGAEEEGGAGEDPAGSEEHCHFHAGVEHCVGGENTCEPTNRDYNMPLRIGLLFVILATSGFGVFAPIFATSFTRLSSGSTVFVLLKQFGTGVVISTAFIHLFTHAQLMFGNECLGELQYEGTTSAVFMAGLFLSFLVDYLGARFVLWHQNKKHGSDIETRQSATLQDPKHSSGSPSTSPDSSVMHHGDQGSHGHIHGDLSERINVMVLEAGIIFHSLLIGLTLVVAGDSFFITLFIVILFHQMFEGIALGSCIAQLPSSAASVLHKLLMGGAFALITPIGMAIGIGVLDHFNGNDPATIIAIGTLDAFSAGILAWVGIVEMLARDWMQGQLLRFGLLKTGLAMFALVAGMALMSLLGKWA